MRNKVLALMLACCSVPVATFADGFVIEGSFPGMKDGSVVKLRSYERGPQEYITETVAKNGAFKLQGTVESPTLCVIYIQQGDDGEMDKSFNLFVENLDMKVSASQIDSVPPSFYFGNGGLLMEKNVVIEGGQAQREYSEFRKYMTPYESESKDAHYRLYIDENRDKSEEGHKRLSARYSEAMLAENKACMDFVASHPGYSISGNIMLRELSEPFTFTASELDEIEKRSAGMWDKVRLAKLNEAIAKSRKYCKGIKYTDFAVLDTDGKEIRISELLGGGKYLLIDFWASWCGPCRQAIPHVRELYQKYGDKMGVAAVSLDSNEKAWRKAMEKENMEWTQLWADQPRVKGVTEPYQISGIPFMLLIDPEGNISFSGHDPDALSDFLSHTFD